VKNATRARKRLGGTKVIDPRSVRDELLRLSIQCSALASASDDNLVDLARTYDTGANDPRVPSTKRRRYRDEMIDARELSSALDHAGADSHVKRIL